MLTLRMFLIVTPKKNEKPFPFVAFIVMNAMPRQYYSFALLKRIKAMRSNCGQRIHDAVDVALLRGINNY